MRTATPSQTALSPWCQHFNPRGPCGPRPGCQGHPRRRNLFQSSRSLRTATPTACGPRPPLLHFNPRGPCGPRPVSRMAVGLATSFQSSRSLRTATGCRAACPNRARDFNPRGPCGPRQACYGSPAARRPNFNPRGPCGPRQGSRRRKKRSRPISILAVLADRDKSINVTHRSISISILAVLADRDKFHHQKALINLHFNPRGPCGPRLNRADQQIELSLFQSSRSLRTATKVLPAVA